MDNFNFAISTVNKISHLLKDKFKLNITIQKDDTFQRNDLMIDYEIKVQSL